MSDLTRSKLIEYIEQRRVIIGARRGEKVHVTIDLGNRSTMAWVDRDWVKPMLEPARGARRR